MLKDRIVVILILVPIGAALLVAGGLPLALGAVLFIAIAGVEMVQLFGRADVHVPAWILCGGSSAIILARLYFGFDHAPLLITAVVLLSIVWSLLQYRKVDPHAATGMIVAVGGVVYLGWLGAYFVSLRSLPNGLWWSLVVLPSVWFTDSIAYLVGRSFGKHHMAPRLSPKKTWEGYLGGVAGGTLGGMILAGLWGLAAGPQSGLNVWNGLIVGMVIGAFSPFGDLAVSMMKREMGAKDTGDGLPGHGGFLDRIDSWLVTAPMGYYLVIFLLSINNWIQK